MTTASLEALTRNIIQHRQLPFTFHSVSATVSGWDIVVRDLAGATLSITVPAGRPTDVRNAIQDRLETAIEDAVVG
jgi:non-ribosomal peptide synthetase component F